MGRAAGHRVEAYLQRLFGYAYCLSGSREQARDLVQDCVVKALAAKASPREEAAYRAWLFTILRHHFIDGCRRDRGAPESLDDEPAVESWEIWRSDDFLLTSLTVKLAMSKLSPAHREIIALVDIVGFSYGEAAELLSVAPGTVMSRLSRARQALLRVIVGSNVRELPGKARGGAT